MKTSNILVAAIAPFLTLIAPFIPSATAQSTSSCMKEVIGEEQGTRVNLRIGPSTNFRSDSYVLVGQFLYLITNSSGQFETRVDRKGYNWYHIEYKPSGIRGWIRQDFLSQDCVRSYM